MHLNPFLFMDDLCVCELKGMHIIMKKCLVTGATGHIGAALVRKLIKEGYSVKALVLEGDNPEALEGLDIDVIFGNICSYTDVAEAITDVSIVYHLAGMIGIYVGQKKILSRVNVDGVKNIIRACLFTGMKKLVYVSSVHAIAELPKEKTIVETLDFDPGKVHGNYAKTKCEATRLVLEACKRGLNATVVHPSGCIGPYEYNLTNMGRLIKDYITRKLPAYIDGAYDFVDVRDVADGIFLAGQKGKTGECYILSGERVTIAQLMEYMEDISKIPKPRLKIPGFIAKIFAPFAEMHYRIHNRVPLFTIYSVATLHSNCNFSNKKAVRYLGYRSRPIRDTLRDTVDWLKKRG